MDFIEIWDEGTLISEERHTLLSIAITNIHAGGAMDKSYYQ